MTVVLFTSAGTASWICPASVTSISIECLGGGGAGSTRTSNGGGGGGGGGAYAKINSFTVTPGNSYSYTVGSAGVVGGADGGDSSFNSTTCVAKGGVTVAANTATGGAGGLASGSTGDIKKDGGSGWTASGSGGGGGSSGGIDSAGNTATSATGGAAVVAGGAGGDGRSGTQGNAPANGSAYGGGGGGGYRTSSGTRTGAAGAAGYVRITYAPYSPTDFWGCHLWLDASNNSTITITSGAVSQWNDQSGNSRHAAQGTGANRPVVQAGAFGLRQGLRFTATQYISTAGNNNFTIAKANPYTFFATINPTSTPTVWSQMLLTSDRSTTGRYMPGLSAWWSATGYYAVASAYGVTSYQSGSGTPTSGTAALVGGTFDGTNVTVYLNGLAGTPVDYSGLTSSNGTGGWDVNGAGDGAAADYGEVVVYSRVLTSTERTAMEGYLTGKWLTQVSAPPLPHNQRGGFRGLIVR